MSGTGGYEPRNGCQLFVATVHCVCVRVWIEVLVAEAQVRAVVLAARDQYQLCPYEGQTRSSLVVRLHSFLAAAGFLHPRRRLNTSAGHENVVMTAPLLSQPLPSPTPPKRPMEDGWVKVDLKKRMKCPPSITVSGDMISSEGGPLFLAKFVDPLSPLLNYFEYVIECVGKETAIGLGVGEKDYSMAAMPGWNANSCGYHADDGKLFVEAGRGVDFAETCTAGDSMGCGVDFDVEIAEEGYVNVFFTKNGQQVGRLVKIKRPVHGLYPMIGLHSGGEKVRYCGHSRRQVGSVAQPMELGEETHQWLRSNGVRFLDDGLSLAYAGSGAAGEMDVGIAQSRYRLSAARHYFEVEILHTGLSAATYIGAGAAICPLHLCPGNDMKSFGYRASDGCVYRGLGKGTPLGATCTAGDRIGCGLKVPPDESGTETKDTSLSEDSEPDCDESTQVEPYPFRLDEDYLFRRAQFVQQLRRRQVVRKPVAQRRLHTPKERALSVEQDDKKCIVFFTKNGEVFGETEVTMPRGGLYPLVAMASRGEQVRVNFHPLTG